MHDILGECDAESVLDVGSSARKTHDDENRAGSLKSFTFEAGSFGQQVPGSTAGSVVALSDKSYLSHVTKAMTVEPMMTPTQGTVLYKYTAKNKTELSIKPGEVVMIVSKGTDEWWCIKKDGITGLVPGTYIKEKRTCPSVFGCLVM